MEFLDVVQQRRAVREYLPRPVERAVLERLIGAAVQAPSAVNLQPWSFAVVSDAGRIAAYAARAKVHLLEPAQAAGHPAELLSMLQDPTFSIFYHAPTLVLVLAGADEPQAREDCCLAAQTLLLAARDAGIGSCWIGLGRPWLNLPATKAELGLPANCHVVAPIVMGYPAAWPPSHGRHPARIHWL